MSHIENYDHCLHFQVLDKVISFLDGASAEVVADNYGNICINIEFDEQWDGIGKTARFIYNGQWIDVPLNVDNECICPSEVVKKGRFSLGVYGSELKTTTPIVVNVRASILSDCEGELPPDPTPGEYNQIMQLYQATCEAADETTRACAEAIEALEASSKLFTESKEELEEGGFITGIKEKNRGSILGFWVGTQKEYDSLPEPPQNCYVIISDDMTLVDLINEVTIIGNKIDTFTNMKGAIIFQTANGIPYGWPQWDLVVRPFITECSVALVEMGGTKVVCSISECVAPDGVTELLTMSGSAPAISTNEGTLSQVNVSLKVEKDTKKIWHNASVILHHNYSDNAITSTIVNTKNNITQIVGII